MNPNMSKMIVKIAMVAVTLLGLLSGSARAGDRLAQDTQSPFPAYLERVLGGSHFEAGMDVDGVSYSGMGSLIARQQEGDFSLNVHAMQSPGDGRVICSVVKAVNAGRTYYVVNEDVKVGKVSDLEWWLPLDDNFRVVTWRLNDSEGDWQADMILADRRQVEFKEGINQMTVNMPQVKPGTPVLLVRLLYKKDESGSFSRGGGPVTVRETIGQRRLSVTARGAEGRFRILLAPYRWAREDTKLKLSKAGEKAVLIWKDVQDTYEFGRSETDPLRTVFAISRRTRSGTIQAVGCGMPCIQEVEPKGSLVAFYDFESLDGGGVTPNSAVSRYPAAVTEGRLVTGLRGQGLYMGKPMAVSQAKIVLPGAVIASLTNGTMTISLWVRLPWGQLYQNPLVFWPYRRPISKTFKPFAQPWTLVNLPQFGAQFMRWDAWDEARISGLAGQVGLRLQPPGWHHVTITVDRKHVASYLDGELFTEGQMTTMMNAGDIGRLHDVVVVEGLWGAIDRLRIHDYAMSERQVADMMRRDLVGRVAYYSFDACDDQGKFRADPVGDAPVDAWDWARMAMVPETTYAASAEGVTLVAGRRGKAVHLNGKQKIVLPKKVMLESGTGEVSLSLWIRLTSEKTPFSIISSANHPKYGLQLGRLHGSFSGFLCGNYDVLRTGSVMLDDHWHHLVLTYDNDTVSLYLDGKVIKQANYVPLLNLQFDNGLVIGEGMEGDIDELEIFNSVLDAGTILEMSRKVD